MATPLERLHRVTDLFVEGTILPLGEDESGPINLWVAKLNSFQVEEARRDGVAVRVLRIKELREEGNPQRENLLIEMERWSDEELAKQRVDQSANERYLEVLDDLLADDEWAEKILTLRRMPELLEGVPQDDPRHQQLQDLNEAYFKQVQERQDKKNLAALDDVKALDRDVVAKEFVEAWIDRLALDDFMAERRKTEIFFATRTCAATKTAGGVWSHGVCTHSELWLEDRKDVTSLPEDLLGKIIDIIDGTTISERDAGNSDAPPSSSPSSEQPSASEASAPSIPEETPSAPPTS